MKFTKSILENSLNTLKTQEGHLKESIQNTEEELKLHQSSLVDNLKRQVELKDALKKFE